MKYQIIAPLQHFLAYTNRENKFPEKLILEGGYSIRKFNDKHLDEAFSSYSQILSEQDIKELKACNFAIYFDYETQNSGYSGIPQDVISNIDHIIYSLRIVKPTCAVRTIVNLQKPNNKVTIPIEIQHTRMPLITYPDSDQTFPADNPRSQFFYKKDAYKIRKYFSNIRYLYKNFGGKYHKVLNAIIFFELGQMTQNYKPRMITIVTGLESLFNTSNEQVGYTLKTRCSYFLCRNPIARLELSYKVKEIYHVRSLFVHGQGADKKLLQDNAKQKELLVDAEQILRECLQKILNKRLVLDKFTNIDGLVVSFDELTMGKIKEF